MYSANRVRPFLKWAGGKYRLVERIADHLPQSKKLIEPFLGSGAVFLNTEFDSYLLADINSDLINLYQTVKSEGKEFIAYASEMFQAKFNSPIQYYSLREEFNFSDDIVRKCSLFLYLNRHGYNGLCRYNSKGEFNVPFGSYKKPYFPENEILHFYNKSKRATFICMDFESALKRARRGNVVYCDPPYVPLSMTAYFTSYAKKVFSMADQVRLAEISERLSARGVKVIISNHDNEITRDIYGQAKIHSFDVQRNISCKGKSRSLAKELFAIYDSKC